MDESDLLDLELRDLDSGLFRSPENIPETKGGKDLEADEPDLLDVALDTPYPNSPPVYASARREGSAFTLASELQLRITASQVVLNLNLVVKSVHVLWKKKKHLLPVYFLLSVPKLYLQMHRMYI